MAKNANQRQQHLGAVKKKHGSRLDLHIQCNQRGW